jgi:hypothetical protein
LTNFHATSIPGAGIAGYISFLERGKNPTLSTVFDLVATLRVPAWELIRR